MDLLTDYTKLTEWIVNLSGGSDKFAHTYIGLAIWLGTLIVARRPIGTYWALIPVFLIEVGNECLDRAAVGSWMWHETLADIAATMFWPVVLTIVVRVGLLVSQTRARPVEPATDSGAEADA
jgi:hypothetical protein